MYNIYDAWSSLVDEIQLVAVLFANIIDPAYLLGIYVMYMTGCVRKKRADYLHMHEIQPRGGETRFCL